METVQSVVHLEHQSMATNASQLAYAQRSSALHRPSQAELSGAGSYKLQQARATAVQQQQQQQQQGSSPSPAPAPPAPAPSSAASQQPSGAPVAASPPTMHPSSRATTAYPAVAFAPAAAVRAPFLQPYGSTVAYREHPYSGQRSAVNSISQGERLLQTEYPVPVVSSAQAPPPLGRPHRISLLQPVTPSQEYLSVMPARPRLQPGEAYREVPSSLHMDLGSPALKKMRLGADTKPPVIMDSAVQQPLRVETGEPAYNPQVEAISPTLPAENLQEDSAFRATKDDLLQQIAKVDREIAKAEVQISKLKKKQQELEEAANKPASVKEEVEIAQPKHQSLAQKIYAENRRKAQQAHDLLEKLGPKVDLPLYNQPSDTAIYHENKRRHQQFRQKLVEHLRRQHEERRVREAYLASSYARQQAEWAKKVERLESSAKRRAREAKNREIFEKVFPELRKQREDRERFNRVGARIKSEADLEEIVDGLQEQEMEDKKMRSYAVIPPILLDTQQRRLTFINNNGHTEDFATEYKERAHLNLWTEQEKEMFKEKFLQHPKNFGAISQSLDRKSVCECVQYYYLTKKTENYKQLLRKSRQRSRGTRNNPANKPSGGAGSALGSGGAGVLGVDISTGVTTRQSVAALQREQQQKQEQQQTGGNDMMPPEPESLPLTSTLQQPVIKEEREEQPAPIPPKPSEGSSSNSTSGKKKERRKEEKKKEEFDSSEEECAEVQDGNAVVLGPHPCAVCKVMVESSAQSRVLARAHAAQYGLSEDDIQTGARVCATCRCKAVRSRYVQCPIPTCPTTKGRVKRLRPLPGKWSELAAEVRDPIIAEFQIPSGVSKCCSACHSRISRRLNPAGNVEDVAAEGWSEEEVERLRRGVREHGTHWARVASHLNSAAPPGTQQSRTQHQCKAFFYAQRKKLSLDMPLQEYQKAHAGEERKPTVTDEEESGSSTSSCDEGGVPLDSSDTASAASPSLASAQQPRLDKTEETAGQTGLTRGPQEISTAVATTVTTVTRDEYDSSATTADEGQGGADGDSQQQRHSPSKGAASVVNGTVPGAPQVPGPAGDQSTCISVKDLMLNVIERTLRKPVEPMPRPNSQAISAPGGSSPQAPTIDSILKTDRPLAFPSREYRGSPSTPQQQQQQQQPQQTQELPKEGLVVMQVQQVQQQALRENSECVTLDLSMRKRASPPPRASPSPYTPQPPSSKVSVSPAQHARSMPPHPEVLLYREGPAGTQAYYHTQEQSGGRGKSPSLYVQDSRAPHLMMNRAASVTLAAPQPGQPQMKMQHSTGPPPPLTPKLVKGGSITHGTPVSGGAPQPGQQMLTPVPPARYEGLIRGQPKESGGSITQGTSLQHHDKRNSGPNPMYERHEVYKQSRSSSPHQFPPSYSPAPPGLAPSPSFYRAPYATEQQLTSRQIIMNDYITSQQMVGRRGSADKDSAARLSPRGSSPHHALYYPPPSANQMYPSSSPQRTPPPPQAQQRQGVIQRHTPRPQPPLSKPMLIPPKSSPPPQRHAYPPGHEAFSSLVDVASQQPSLPVPKEPPQSGPPPLLHEGLGKGLADSQHILTSQHKGVLTEEQEKALLQESVRRGYYHDFVTLQEQDKRFKELQHQAQYNAMHRQRELQLRQQNEARHIELRRNELRQNELRQNEMRQNEIRQNEMRQNEMRQNEMRQNELRQNELRQNEIRQNEMRQKEMRQQELRQQDRQRNLAAEMEKHRHYYHQPKERDAARHVGNYHPPTTSAPRSSQPAPPQQRTTIQQSTPPPPRVSQASTPSQAPPAGQAGGAPQAGQDSSTMTAASLIHAIITHQINQNSESEQQPTQPRPGDTLFQSFQRDAPPSTSQPSGSSNVECRSSSPRKPVPPHADSGEDKPAITLGEHINSIITKDLASPSQNYQPSEHWKMRRKEPAADKPPTSSASLAPNERQIIRIAQPTSPRPPYNVEPVSPPEQPPPAPETAQHWHPGMPLSYMQRPFHSERNAVPPNAANEPPRSGKPHLSPLDYVKNRIVEVMRTSEEDHPKPESHFKRPAEDSDADDAKRFKSSPAASKDSAHEDEKRDESGEKEVPADSPQSTDMVIDEEQGKMEPVSPATSGGSSYYPPVTKSDNSSYYPSSTYPYPFSALSVRTNPPLPATTSAAGPSSQSSSQPSQAIPPAVSNAPPSQSSTPRPSQSQNPSSGPPPSEPPQSQQQQQPSQQTTQQASSRPEPAPLLSSQYEPLSDADD